MLCKVHCKQTCNTCVACIRVLVLGHGLGVYASAMPSSVSPPMTLTLKGPSWCKSMLDKTGSDALEQ